MNKNPFQEELSTQFSDSKEGKEAVGIQLIQEVDRMYQILSSCYDDYLKGNKVLMSQIVHEMISRHREKEHLRLWIKVCTKKLIDIFKRRLDPSYLIEVVLYQMPWFDVGNEYEIAIKQQEIVKNFQENQISECQSSASLNSNVSAQKKTDSLHQGVKKASPHFELFSELSKFIMMILSFSNSFAPQILKFLVSNIVPIEVKEIDGCKKSEIQITLEGQIFENQKMLLMTIRDCLNKYTLNSISDVQELNLADSNFIIEVLKYHPNAKEKMSDFKKLLIGQAQFDEKISRCLYILTKSGKKIDISYVKSVQNLVDEQFYKRGLKHGSPNQKKMMSQITNLLTQIIKIYPLYQIDLIKIIQDSYPHRVQGEQFHKIYLTNTLQLAILNPSLQQKILAVVLQKLLEIDSEIKLDHNMEGQGNEKTSQIMAEKLDWLMIIVFEFIDFQMKDKVGEDSCFGEIQKRQSEDGQEETEEKLFKVFLNLFNEHILLTHQSKYVQFTMFYLCSLRKQFQNLFLNQLMANITKKNSLLYKSTQINSIYYLGSYLARAKYIPNEAIATIFNFLIDHLSLYLTKFNAQTRKDTYNEGLHRIHKNLYHLLQAMLYIMCFRFSSVSNPAVLSKFTNILREACKNFNALYFISPSISNVFIRVCETFGANELLDLFQNEEKISQGREQQKHVQTLDTYFPFDPYCLQYSDKYICEIYQNWQDFYYLEGESIEKEEQIEESDPKYQQPSSIQNKSQYQYLNSSFLNITLSQEGNTLTQPNFHRVSSGFTIDKLNNVNEFEYDRNNMILDDEDKPKLKLRVSKKDIIREEVVLNDDKHLLQKQIKGEKSGEDKKLHNKRKNPISTTENSVNTTPLTNHEEDSQNANNGFQQHHFEKYKQISKNEYQDEENNSLDLNNYSFGHNKIDGTPKKKQRVI